MSTVAAASSATMKRHITRMSSSEHPFMNFNLIGYMFPLIYVKSWDYHKK